MKRISCFLLACCLFFGLSMPVLAADKAAVKAADRLYDLGLFTGSGVLSDGSPNYDLDRAPTRHEAVTMLVRLLGKEEAAKARTWNTPFTDVAAWARPYVGYAYANGLTNGTGSTTFGGEETISATQYLTFVLRALGYDSSTDFRWDAAWELSDRIGLTKGQYNENTKSFMRADVVLLSSGALDQKMNDSRETLLDRIERMRQEEPTPAPVPAIVKEPDPDWPIFFHIDGQRVCGLDGLFGDVGMTYTVRPEFEGEMVDVILSVESNDKSLYTIKDNGDGSFDITAKKAGEGYCSVFFTTPRHPDFERRSDLVFSFGDTRISGLALRWRGRITEPGTGFGISNQKLFVPTVEFNGVQISDYTVVSNDGNATFTIQADGSLLIEKPNTGVAYFTVTYGGQSAVFNVRS